MSVLLGVNIDHVATLRQSRRGSTPSILDAAQAAVAGGADGITIHLREDRRHIQDADVELLVSHPGKPVFRVNLEMAPTDEMVSIASRIKPHSVCLVPERREELTTEGGLNVMGDISRIKECTRELRRHGIAVSHFVDPDPWQLDGVARCGAEFVELATGAYARRMNQSTHSAPDAAPDAGSDELRKLVQAAQSARKLGLRVNAGHGLDLKNVSAILCLEGLEELNIGFSIVARAIFVGLERAVREMKTEICEPNAGLPVRRAWDHPASRNEVSA